MQTLGFHSILELLFAAGLHRSGLVSASASDSACPCSQLSVRLPPFIDPALNASNTSSPSSGRSSSFLAPPSNFFAGTWYVTNTSQTLYQSYGNLQWDLSPAIPKCEQNTTAACPAGTVAGVLNEVSTWVPVNNSIPSYGAIGGGGRSVSSIRAYNTPRRLDFPTLNSDWDAVFENSITEGVPEGWRVDISVLYWGSDANGVPFFVTHETSGIDGTGRRYPPCISVLTMNPASPSEASLTDVLQALKHLGNLDLTELVEAVAPVKWDIGLVGGPAICGTTCLRNEVV